MSVAYRAEIGGSPGSGYVVLLNGFDINESAQGVNTLVCNVLSEAGTYRPEPDDEFVLYRTDQGSPETIRFAGFIIDAEEQGFAGPNDDAIVVRVTVTDYKDFLERQYVTGDRPSETLEARLTWLESEYLTDYSVTLDPSQATGPTLAANKYDGSKTILEVVNELMTETLGWVPTISYAKVFGMYQPGTVAAPFDVLEGAGTETGDIRVKRSRTQSVNRVIVTSGPTTPVQVSDSWTGDGVTDEFDLSYQVTGNMIAYVRITEVGSPAVYRNETIDEIGVGAYWEIDRNANTIRVGNHVNSQIPASGELIEFVSYLAQSPHIVSAEDTADIAARGVWEKKITLAQLLTIAAAQAIAEGELAKRLQRPTVVVYQTRTTGLTPGMTQHITSARRDIDADFSIQQVVERFEDGSETVICEVTAVDTDQYTDWRQWHRDILANAGGGGGGSNIVLYGQTSTAAGIAATAYGSEPSSPASGDVDLYTNAPLIARYDGSVWVPYLAGPKLTTPPTSGWSWVNQGSATISTTRGGQLIEAPGTAVGANLHLRVRTMPSAPYTITTFIQGHPYVDAWKGFGVGWRESASGKLVIVSFGANGFPAAYLQSVMAKYASPTSFSAAYTGSGTPVPNTGVWVRMIDDATDRKYSMSHDGQTWLPMYSVGNTDYLTADQVGFWVSSEAAGGTQQLSVVAHLLSWEES